MPPPARLLDLSRLTSRAARVLTGVDRVERAYLDACVTDPVPCFGLVRTALGWLLLDRDGMRAMLAAIQTQDWGHTRLIDRLARRKDLPRAAVEGFLRRHAIARATRRGLAGMLSRQLPQGVSYVNVGQTSLRADTVAAVRGVAEARIAVMIHDTIPLDYPDWQRAGSVPAFAARLELAARSADLVIANSRAVAADCARHMAPFGRVPPILAAHLGVDLTEPDPVALPPGVDMTTPYFVILGTIEPRKNHALLLDIWGRLGPDAPHLFVVGGRGWNSEAVFARLDAGVPGVTELSGLGDGAVAALVAGARSLLFPSYAEGFGLPALEAAGRGVPVLCGDLAIWREMLGDWPVYLPLHDAYLWQNAVETLARVPQHREPMPVPSWVEHFKTVFTKV